MLYRPNPKDRDQFNYVIAFYIILGLLKKGLLINNLAVFCIYRIQV